MDAHISEKVFLVTGATGGIGSAIVKALAAEGAVPIIHTHQAIKAAQDLARDVAQTYGITASVVQADLSQSTDTQKLWASALSTHPQVHGVVANAGIWPAEPKRLDQIPEDQWRHTLATNLDGVYHTVRGFFEHLQKVPRQAASLTLIGSTAGLFGEAGHADYAASKAALAFGLTPSLKNEIIQLAPAGRVNCICPGWTQTPMADSAVHSPDIMKRALSTVALEKIATPDDIAQAVVYLGSDRLAGHISGLVMPIHGGMEGRVLH